MDALSVISLFPLGRLPHSMGATIAVNSHSRDSDERTLVQRASLACPLCGKAVD